MPVSFAIKLATGDVAMPSKLAQRIVEGGPPRRRWPSRASTSSQWF